MIRASILGLLSALAVAILIACTSLSGQDAGASAPCAAPSAGAEGCVLPALAAHITDPWDGNLTSVSSTCGVQKEVAAAMWASHQKAEVLEGFVPRAVGVDAGVRP